MIEDKNLMACPFCGGFVHQDKSAEYFRELMLYCEGCDMYFALDDINATEEKLEIAFNTRAQDKTVKPYIDGDGWNCGNCGKSLTLQKNYFKEYFSYCPDCGAKVAWDQTEQKEES